MAEGRGQNVSHAYASIKAGVTLRFRLRAHPTCRSDAKSGPDSERSSRRRSELRTEARQLDWLRRKGAFHGFEIVAVSASGAAPNVEVSDRGKSLSDRSSARASSALTFASVLFESVLRVVDVDAFRLSLEQGVGSAKAYGFGLLSVGSVSAD